jgi:hypothetical protein
MLNLLKKLIESILWGTSKPTQEIHYFWYVVTAVEHGRLRVEKQSSTSAPKDRMFVNKSKLQEMSQSSVNPEVVEGSYFECDADAEVFAEMLKTCDFQPVPTGVHFASQEYPLGVSMLKDCCETIVPKRIVMAGRRIRSTTAYADQFFGTGYFTAEAYEAASTLYTEVGGFPSPGVGTAGRVAW